MRECKTWVRIVIGIVGLVTPSAGAVTVDLGTTGNAANWKITGAGVTAATAYQVNGNAVQVNGHAISLSDNSFPTGTYRAGGSAANFNGFWYADLTFPLPANATNPSLQFNNLFADDRVVLQLNGTNLGDFVLNGLLENGPLTGAGVMSFPPGPPDQAFTFTGITSGTVTSGFVIGGDNFLRFVLNNTNTASTAAPTRSYVNSGDAVYVNLAATLTYDVPEPGCLWLGGLAFFALSRRRPARGECRTSGPRTPEVDLC